MGEGVGSQNSIGAHISSQMLLGSLMEIGQALCPDSQFSLRKYNEVHSIAQYNHLCGHRVRKSLRGGWCVRVLERQHYGNKVGIDGKVEGKREAALV